MSVRRTAGSVGLALLIVAASVVSGVGLMGSAVAQTDTYTQEFNTGPHKVEVDLSNVTTETTISVITSGSPAGDNATIMKKTVSGTTSSAHFRNAGAYETFTVQVAGADAKPGFSKGGVLDAWTPGDPGKFLGDTGGDAGFTYDTGEQIGESLQPQIVQLDRTGLPGNTNVNTTGTDAAQTELDIYQSAQNSKARSDNYQTTLDNYLSDTKTQARIIGKNAYIRALNNGSSKSAAKTEAKNAVSDYYAVKQTNLANEWTVQVEQYNYLSDVVSSETGVSSGFIYTQESALNGGMDETRIDNTPSTTVSLVNGSTATVTGIEYTATDGSNDAGLVTADPTTVPISKDQTLEGQLDGIAVTAPDSNYDDLTYMDLSAYTSRWATIQSQNTQVQNDMDTLAENTYSAYQQGEINSSDLVDPYVLANERSAGDNFDTWATSQLTLLGQNSPDNLESGGSFEVTTSDGTTYEGVLTSPENPASGQFEAGTTYKTSDIGGTQYVVASDEIVKLSGTFTVGNITTSGGEQVQNATIQKTQYTTTNVTELKQLYEDLAYRRAEIEAREQALAGGGGFSLGGLGESGPVAIVAVAGAALLLLKD